MTSVTDSTDPETRRPVEPMIAKSGSNFEPIERPQRDPKITCSAAGDAYALFTLFFSDEHLQIIVDNTNKNAQKPSPLHVQERQRRGRDLGGLLARTWIDTTIGELHAYLAILIYMGINKQNQIQDYWCTRQNVPSHPVIYESMSLNQFQQLQRHMHISDPEREGPAHIKVHTCTLPLLINN